MDAEKKSTPSPPPSPQPLQPRVTENFQFTHATNLSMPMSQKGKSSKGKKPLVRLTVDAEALGSIFGGLDASAQVCSMLSVLFCIFYKKI